MAGEEAKAPAPAPLVTDGDKVAIRDTDGTITLVHRNDLQQARSEGAVPATEKEWQNAKLGTSGEIAAGAIGLGQGGSAGFALPIATGAARAVGLNQTADDIARGFKIAKETSPNAMLGGEVAGTIAGAALLPGGGGAAPTATSVLGRAGERVVAAAPRAFLEGGVIGTGQQATEDAIDDKPFAASSYLTSAYKGGVIGLLTAGTLNAGGGALADLVPRFRGATGTAAVDAGILPAEAGPIERRSLGKISIDPDAGLNESAGAIEKPFTFGPGRRSVGLDTGALEGEFASGVSGGTPIRSRGYVDAEIPEPGSAAAKDFYLRGHDLSVPEEAPIPFMRAGKLPRIRGDEDFEAAAPVFSKGIGVERGMVPATERAPFSVRLGIDPDAGLAAEAGLERDPFKISRGKTGSREVQLGDIGPEGTIGSRRGFSITHDPVAAAEEAAAARAGAPAKSIADRLDDQADRFAFKATGAKGPDVRRLGLDVDSQQEEMQRIGARLRSESVGGEPLLTPTTTQAQFAKRIAERTQEVGKGLGQMRQELDKAVARPSQNLILQRFEAEVARPALKMPGGEADVRTAQEYLNGMLEKGGERPSFDTLYQYRRRLDDKLAKEYLRTPGLAEAPGTDAMHKLRGIIEDEYVSAGERASQEIGSEFATKYKLQKELYADLAVAKKISMQDAARNGGANFFSLTDAIAGFSHGGVGGVAAVAGNQVRRKFGDQIVSHVLGSAANLLRVQKAAGEVDAALNAGTKKFVQGTGAASARPAKNVTAEEVRSLRDSIRTPDMVQAKVQAALGAMSEYAPKTAAAATYAASRAAAWLRDNLPKESAPTGLVFNRPVRPMSHTELLKAAHQIETAEDPTIVVDRLLEGRLTRDHIEALKGTHPEVYAKTQNYIREHATELKDKLSTQQEAALSMLFGQPVSEAFLPANIRAFQSSLKGGDQGPGKGGSPGGAGSGASNKPIHGIKNPGGSVGTEMDSIEKGDKS